MSNINELVESVLFEQDPSTNNLGTAQQSAPSSRKTLGGLNTKTAGAAAVGGAVLGAGFGAVGSVAKMIKRRRLEKMMNNAQSATAQEHYKAELDRLNEKPNSMLRGMAVGAGVGLGAGALARNKVSNMMHGRPGQIAGAAGRATGA